MRTCDTLNFKKLIGFFAIMDNLLGSLFFRTLFAEVDYKDEYTVISSTQKSRGFAEMRCLSFRPISQIENVEDLIVKSNKLREQGNKLFQAGPKQNALAASRFYTEAIFVAPLVGESLALAYANRAAALMKFGYIQQAYDDCECALELGYPENLRVKIWMREANCAQQLGDVELLSKHIDVLDNHKLAVNFIKPFEKLKQELRRLLECANNQNIVRNGDGLEKNTTSLHRETYKIVSLNKSDRCMIATEFIPKGGLIFEKDFISFAVMSDHVCHQCAITLLIPFPCYRCHGKVVYCSLKCRREHQLLHSIECFGDQKFFMRFEPYIRLIFRLVVEHFPRVAATLRYAPSAKRIWYELTAEGGLVHSANPAYAQILDMKTREKRTKEEILEMSIYSCLLVEYLSTYTNFFNMAEFEGSRARSDDWMLIVGSLILRHYFQVRHNGTYSASLCRFGKHSIGFDLMDDKLWIKPWHIRCGFLYQFQLHEQQSLAILPYKGLCRHNCEMSFDTKYSGRSVRTFATKPIKAGEEIFDCYFMDYRVLEKQGRGEVLKGVYDITCKCSRCTDPLVEEYSKDKFYRFRCENMDCRKSFVPFQARVIDKTRSVAKQLSPNTPLQVRCPHCKRLQLNLYKIERKIERLLPRLAYRDQRHQLFKSYEALDNYLLHSNILKLKYATGILQMLFRVDIDFRLRNTESAKLINMAKFLLRGWYEMFGQRSDKYVSAMVYIWDIIALGKYKPQQSEMKEMLEAVEALSDEMKKVFKNYYHDFIADKF